ncbi:hypothetical protein GN244_ATG15103 [Phytophthora infestans]|uniref:Uncharacterized protein n=1 Tax=Phytophthora infestans TaxID=4787 RepID=A0A833T355_PHYIN|nr:hypothetical protein GN244_ATG15103 [Phytophthora infestans]
MGCDGVEHAIPGLGRPQGRGGGRARGRNAGRGRISDRGAARRGRNVTIQEVNVLTSATSLALTQATFKPMEQ